MATLLRFVLVVVLFFSIGWFTGNGLKGANLPYHLDIVLFTLIIVLGSLPLRPQQR